MNSALFQLLALSCFVSADFVDIEKLFFSQLTDYDPSMLPDITTQNGKNFSSKVVNVKFNVKSVVGINEHLQTVGPLTFSLKSQSTSK